MTIRYTAELRMTTDDRSRILQLLNQPRLISLTVAAEAAAWRDDTQAAACVAFRRIFVAPVMRAAREFCH